MPMDYDDSDISCRSLQVAGEGRSKSSSVLIPFDFPKFDFDDNLQAHLRFDNLVETEVFLGIQSQEDNRWIEDFSRGSNGMEFNATPASSCSIPKRNNVWSEATSSESVEMLLKSVGQEELIMAGDSMRPESNGCNDQSSLVRREKPSSEFNMKNDENLVTSKSTVLQGNLLEDQSASEGYVEKQLLEPEGPLGNHGSLNSVFVKGGSSRNEENPPDSDILKDSRASAEKHENFVSQKDSMLFAGCNDNVSSSHGGLSTFEMLGKVNANISHKNCSDDVQGKLVCCGTEQEGSKILQGTIGIHVNTVETPDVAGNKGSELQSFEGENKSLSLKKSVQIGKHELQNSTSNTEMTGSFDGCQVRSIVDSTDQHSAELGSISAGQCAALDLKMEEVEASPYKSESTHGDKKDLSQNADCIDVLNISKSSEMVVLSSAAESSIVEKKEKSDSMVSKAKPSAQLSSLVGTSEQGMEGSSVVRPVDCPESRNIFKTEGKKNLPSDAGNVDPAKVETPISDQRTQVVDAGVDVKENENDGALDAKSNAQDVEINTEKRTPMAIGFSCPDNSHAEAVTDKASEAVKKSNDICSSGAALIEAHESLQSNLLQPDKSCLKGSDEDNLVSTINHEATLMKVEGEKASAQAAEVDKASCGSPTIISSSEPLQMEKGTQEEGRGCEAVDSFVKIQSISEDPQRSDAIGGDSSFTFKVSALPDTTESESARTWSPVPSVEKCDSSVVVKETNLSGEGRTPRTPAKRTPQHGPPVSHKEHARETTKGTSERKGRRASAKGMSKDMAKKGNRSRVTNQESAKEDNVSSSFLSTISSGAHVQSGKAKSYKNTEQCNIKLPGVAAVPDLNNSALDGSNSPSASFRQPFTDVQQVQLRGQIFVYGSLIQGTVPDEACMVSAFGISGDRSCWEPFWQAALERIQSKKCNLSSKETPVHPPSVARVSDAAVKQGLRLSKGLSSPVARVSCKGTSAEIVNPIIPLSSPLWSMSAPSHDNIPSSSSQKRLVVDYQNAVTPLRSYQTPPLRKFIGHTSWPSPPSLPNPWLTSPTTSSVNLTTCSQPVTMMETVQLTSVKDRSGPLVSSMDTLTSNPSVQTLRSSPVYVGVSLPSDPKGISSTERHSVDSKRRRRKKVQTSNVAQVSLLSEARTDVAVSNKATILPSCAAVSASVSPTSAPPASNPILSKMTAACSADHRVCGDLDARRTMTGLEEMPSKVAEAQSQAEDAAALAATAVNHSENLWKQLSKQKESGLTVEIETKLSSAAVTIAAAASVAKAAAAAAKVAFNAALQAQLMADLTSSPEKMSGLVPSSGMNSVDLHDIENATLGAVLKGNNIANQSNSVLATKPVAERRIETTSAASKQAENLDAIVKAAELAAAAVSQAGQIVAMGEPLPLSDLIEAGPEGYWRSTQPSSELAAKARDGNKEFSVASGKDESAEILDKDSREDSALKEGAKTECHDKVSQIERSNDGLLGDITQTKHTGENDLRSSKNCKAPDTAKSSGVVSEPDRAGSVQNDPEEMVDAFQEDNIKEGSAVEVFKQGDGLKSAWYCANVMSLEDGKAYVCYTDLSSDEGSGNLCEWVPVDGEGDKAPKIRSAYPLTGLQFQGKRKRRRSALGDYAWSVGDRVDVWIDDCWREGVVTERNEKDETTLKVHFPAQGEASIVRSWNLRASRLWNDGKWVKWSSSKGRDASEQSDTPKEKRHKLGSPALLTKGKDKLATEVDSASGNPEKLKLLDLSTSDRLFDVGKTTKDGKRGARKPLRTGQQKEGSRVVFGVPKPTGKKRKFVDLAASRSDTTSEATDSVKFAKYLMPQAAAPRWKVPSRNDSNVKQKAEPRPRVPSSRRSNRTLPQRSKVNSTSGQGDGTLRHHGKDINFSVDYDEETSEKAEHSFSASEEASEAPLSSLVAQSQSTSTKKISSSNSRNSRQNKGKLAPPAGKLNKIVEDKVHADNAVKSDSEVTEPRRSNRKIQPTHRLLEGLQSSMIVPKMSSVSHDQGQRNARRNVPTRGNK